jgi:hypothetical protein
MMETKDSSQGTGLDLKPDSFAARFCAAYNCSPENFAERAAYLCLHPDHRFLAKCYWHFDRESFATDIDMITLLGRATNYDEFKLELETFRKTNPVHGLLRKELHLRVSGLSLLRLARQLFSESK